MEQMALPVLSVRVTQRIAFAKAASAGLSVVDYSPIELAAEEITTITHELERFVNAEV